MSSASKRRKLGGQGPPQSAASAVSAIAARRRLVASAVENQGSSAEPLTPNTNAFSALQSLMPSKEAEKSPKRSAKQSYLRRNDSNRPSGPVTPKGVSHTTDTVVTNTASSASSSQQPVTSYSSFELSRNNHRIKANGIMEIEVDESERFVVLGSFGIRVTRGEVKMAGATLRASESIFWVHAPHCLALPVIRTTQDSRLELHSDSNLIYLRKLGRLSPLLRKMWNEPADADGDAAAGRSFKFISTSSDAPKRCIIQELASPPEWNRMMDSVLPSEVALTFSKRPCTAFICGPKSAGKSTFARLLTNRLLTSSHGNTKAVIVLDLDPGQPEFAPPGTLSLIRVSRPNFGAPFTHTTFDDPSNKILRCHALASVTPASAPDLFVACATELYETYLRSYRKCPLVINTPGWILGTGQDLLVELITKIRPAEVIYMSQDGPADVVDVLKAATKQKFTTLPSQPSEFMSRTAAHFRSMQMMSYFHSQTVSDASWTKASSIKWLTQPLTSVRPYLVQYEGKNSGIMGILSYDFQTPPDLLAASIDGSIVAIVEIEELAAFREFGKEFGRSDKADAGTGAQIKIHKTRDGLPYIVNSADSKLDPRHCRTVGLALIRGIDTQNRTLQVITPLPIASLEQIRSGGRRIALVHGNFDSPHWAYTEDLYDKSTQDDLAENELQISDGDTSEEEENQETAQANPSNISTVPWIETLKGNQKRPVGSRVWRVRRDLGRNHTD
ncbi:Polynucleotide 5'-hydroxyl-kinase grc3 [Conoideocrella luteorostrata]|uniref:Polynucleotide 5'-hydroxyl-kinase GRC3 n=1 Tax=Conoideocrella luteorostrata TaxID=1105319 RepID=A0AAJ0CHQ1_9HYPO|nr:Polynucleotide 5'-hydroxyl-kinase grc3 [Conoideocrella luteorostrata]